MSFTGGDSANFDIVVNTSGLDQAGAQGGQAFSRITADAEKAAKGVDTAARRISEDLKSIGKTGAATGQSFAKGVTEGVSQAQRRYATFLQDVESLARTSAARQQRFLESGLNPDLAALFHNEEGKLLSFQRDIEANRARIISDSDVRRAYQLQFESIRKSVTQEGAQLQSIQKVFSAEQAKAASSSTAKIQAQRAAQLEINAAKVAGQQRVQITRAALETIGRLEKGGADLVKGLFRTSVGAVGKLWDGTVGTVSRSFQRRREIIQSSVRNEQGILAGESARIGAIGQRLQTGLVGSLVRTASLFGGAFFAIQQIRKTFDVGNEFATGLRVLQVQLGLTDKQMQSIRQTAIDLGNDITLPGISALDAAQGINLMAKQFSALGAAAPEAARKTAKAAIQLGLAVKATTEDASGAVGAAVNVFGISTDKAIQAADILTKALSKSAGIAFTDFRDSFVQAAPVVASFLKPVEGATGALVDFNTALAVLAKQGIIGEVAGAGLKQFFIQGSNLSKEGLKQQALIIANAKTSGTVFFNAAHQARPLAEVINVLQQGLKGYSQQQRNAALSSIFGSRSVTIANALLNTQVGDYLKLQATIRDSTGAAAEFANAQKVGVARALDNVSSTIDTARIKFFEFVTGGASGKGPVSDLANNFADLFAKLLNDGGVFTTVRRGLLGIGAGLAAIVAAKAGVEVLGLLAKALPLLGTPFGLLVGSAAALGAAFFIASGRSKNFRDAIDKTRKELSDFAGVVQQKAVQGLRLLGRLLTPLGRLAASEVQPLVERIRNLGLAVGRFLAPALGPLRDFASFLRSAFDFLKAGRFQAAFDAFRQGFSGLGDTIKRNISNIDFADVARTIAQKLSTTLGRALTGAGIGAVTGGLIAGPLGLAVGAALGAAIGLAIPRLRAAISSIDVPALFGKLLNGVRLVGREIGLILSDKRTILAVAGIAAAAAALAIEFVQGFVSGILSHLGDIRAAGAEILKQIFNAPSIVKSVLAFVILLRRALVPAVVGVFRQTGTQAGAAMGEAAASQVSTGGFIAKLKTAGSFAGTVLGQTIAIGLSAALSGSALGSAKSGLEKGLGIAGVAASAAQAFVAGSALSGGNVAVGATAAAASLAVSGLSAAFANNAKKAQENKDAVLQLADAFKQGGDSALLGQVQQTIASFSSKDLSNLNRAQFSIKAFFDAVQSGAPLSGAQGFITGGPNSLDAKFEKLGDVSTATENRIEGALFALADHITQAMKLSGEQTKILGDNLDAAGQQAVITAGRFREADAAATTLFNKQQNADRLKALLDETAGRAANLQAEANAARGAIHDLLFPPTGAEAKNTAIAQIPQTLSGLQEAVNSNLTGILKNANVQQGVTDLVNNIKTGIEGILTDPGVKNKQQEVGKLITDAISGVKSAPGIDTATRLIAINALNTLQTQLNTQSAQNPITLAINADTTAQAAQAQTMANDFIAAFAKATGEAPPIDVTKKIEAAQTPQQAAAIMSDFVFAANQAAGRTSIQTPKITPDTAGAEKAGKALAEAAKAGAGSVSFSDIGASLAGSLALGIQNHTQAGVDAAAIMAHQVAQAAKNALKIGSPSKIFVEIGKDITDGLAEGLKVGTSDATGASEQLAQAVINAALTAQQRARLALSAGQVSLFEAMFGDVGAAAASAVDAAKGSFTTGLSGIADALDSAASQLFAAAAKKPGERTLADRLLIGENVRSLNLGDELGVGNRNAIATAVKSIEDIGSALLKQGQSATTVAKTLATYRAQLLAFTTVLGFNRTQVDALLNSLGLSASAIQNFVNQARILTGVVNEAQGQAGRPVTAATPPPLKTGPNPTQSFIFSEGAIQINPPHGDPNAIALTLINRVAAGIH